MDIASYLQVQVNEVQSSATLGTENGEKLPVLRPSEKISPEENAFHRRMFGNSQDIAQVRFRRLHCTACDAHIGSAPIDAENMHEHPVLKTLLCSSCRLFYGDGDFEQGDDATDMFCRWCANGGNLYCCSYCSNTFCDKCIKRNFDSEIRAKIEADEKWKCFVCDPKDLFTHRSVCRALLQHVRTLAKIIMGNQSMDAPEIEEKMELDDTTCCLGRKRRQNQSTSEEEDNGDGEPDQYSPAQRKSRLKNGSAHKRRKSSSTRESSNTCDKSLTLNGTSRFIPIAPKYVLQEMPEKYKTDEADDIPPPLLQCEQTMIECENQTVTPQGIVLPVSKLQKSQIFDSILNNSALSLNPIPKQNIVRPSHPKPIALRPLHSVNSIPPGATIHRLPANVPMVTLPARPILSMESAQSTSESQKTPSKSSNYLRCKSLSRAPVINIDSDPEELMVIESINTQTQNKKKVQETDNNSMVTEILVPSRRFEEAVNNPLKTIDSLLKNLRERLIIDFETLDSIPDNEVVSNRQKLHIINNNVQNVVNELATFNNSMVSKYKKWKECHVNGEPYNETTEQIVLKKNERTYKLTPLDMECVRDSESEDEGTDDDVNAFFNFSQKLSKIIDIKDSISQGTLAKVETEDKGIQVYGIPKSVDYDMSIGYSLLMRADYDFDQNKEIYKPVIIHDENFGKFEEQFIFYLQDWEDRKKDFNENDPEPVPEKVAEVSLLDLIDADISKKNEDETNEQLTSTAASINSDSEESSKVKNSSVVIDNSSPITAQSLDDPKEKDNADDDNDHDKPTSSQEAKNDETICAVNALIEDDVEHFDTCKAPVDDECKILE